jgi:Membrane bound beta barrel domain (DUF5777)
MKACSNDQLKCLQFRKAYWIVLTIISIFAGHAGAQEEMAETPKLKPVKNTFESIWHIDQQTVMVPIKGTFEMDIQHRFGIWNKGYKDFYGIFAPSNIRIGLDYVPVNRLLVGLGFTKFSNLWDFYGKYAILKQMEEGGSPVSIDYYFNAAVDTRREEDTQFTEGSDRWSFFHQVMIASKISEKFSLQVAGNMSWFNFKELHYDSEGIELGRDQSEHFSVSAIARYKLSNTIGLLVQYDQPISEQEFFDPEPNLSVGFELVTSAHAFQLFIGNFQGLVPQYNHTYNSYDPFNKNLLDEWDPEYLIGFNITRLWNF